MFDTKWNRIALGSALVAALGAAGCAADTAAAPEETLGQTESAVGSGTFDAANGYPYVGRFSYAAPGATVAHGCTGVLITPVWVLTANHCITGDIGPVTAAADHTDDTTLQGDVRIDFDAYPTATSGPHVGVHTFRTSGPIVVRLPRMIHSGDEEDSAMDLALIKLDAPITAIAPHHPPTTAGACSDSFDGTVIGYGPTALVAASATGNRTFARSLGWSRDTTASGESVHTNSWTWGTSFQGPLPGDSGGPLLRDDGVLCGISSRYYVGWFATDADVAAVDSPANVAFILSHVTHSGFWDGEVHVLPRPFPFVPPHL